MTKGKTMPWLIEVCAADISSVKAAVAAGANRIELCSGLSEGGITPSAGLMKEIRRITNVPVRVLIRPRAGDFCYLAEEVEMMRSDIVTAIELGMDGFVLGALLPDGNIDTDVMHRLLESAGSYPWTFHRAFDFCCHPTQSLEEIIRLGADTLLTSGQAATAEEGIAMLSEWVTLGKGRIEVMAGAGINPGNIAHIARSAGCTSFHLSGRSPFKNHLLPVGNAMLNAKAQTVDDLHLITDGNLIYACKNQLNAVTF